jgi:hypothetical protein
MPGKARTRWSVALLAMSCAALLSAQLTSPAAAFHIPGASYSGYASGGSITFIVSSDGSSVTNLTLNGVHAGDCAVRPRQYQPIPINDNSFDNGEVSGNFPNVRGAYGRLNIVVPGLLSSCRVTGTWSAVTSADPSGSQECKSAQAKVKKRKRAMLKAERNGEARKLRKLQGRWRKARAQRDQFCG